MALLFFIGHSCFLDVTCHALGKCVVSSRALGGCAVTLQCHADDRHVTVHWGRAGSCEVGEGVVSPKKKSERSGSLGARDWELC